MPSSVILALSIAYSCIPLRALSIISTNSSKLFNRNFLRFRSGGYRYSSSTSFASNKALFSSGAGSPRSLASLARMGETAEEAMDAVQRRLMFEDE